MPNRRAWRPPKRPSADADDRAWGWAWARASVGFAVDVRGETAGAAGAASPIARRWVVVTRGARTFATGSRGTRRWYARRGDCASRAKIGTSLQRCRLLRDPARRELESGG